MGDLLCIPTIPEPSLTLGNLPALEDLGQFVEEMCERHSPRKVVLPKAVDLTDDPDLAYENLRWLEVVRDLTGGGLIVEWSIAKIEQGLTPFLHHLFPPKSIGDELPSVRAWKNSFAFGMHHWRRGTTFVSVSDKRNPAVGNHFILDDIASHAIFLKAQHVTNRSALEGVSAEALSKLEEENIILSLGTWCLSLPYRMVHWPVPYTSV